jgi:hypothetical protein
VMRHGMMTMKKPRASRVNMTIEGSDGEGE